MNATTVRERHSATDPLHWFTVPSASDLAHAVPVEPLHLPQPYHSLLVHKGSMTERLERRFGSPATLEILSVFADEDRYARWILLLDPTGRCVEMGASCLDLDGISAGVRSDILEGVQPLGRLLSRHGLLYRSAPESFFGLDPPPWMLSLLQMETTRRVFGRRTELQIGGRKAGNIVEVLPCYEVQTQTPPRLYVP
jgi:chorismate-pyruvate lyase